MQLGCVGILASIAPPPRSSPLCCSIDIHKGKVKQIVGSTLRDLDG